MIDKKIFDFIYYEALKDATLRNTCSSEIRKELFEIDSYKKSKLSVAVKEIVRNYIDTLFKGELKEETCKNSIIEICDEINTKDKSGFTFGNAQKLINMSAKYFYISVFKCDESYRKKFEFCHCPMDSILMEKLTNKYWTEISKGDIKYKKDINGKPWSSLTESDISQYKNYQKAIKLLGKSDEFKNIFGMELYPIEIDYCIWGEKKNEEI